MIQQVATKTTETAPKNNQVSKAESRDNCNESITTNKRSKKIFKSNKLHVPTT